MADTWWIIQAPDRVLGHRDSKRNALGAIADLIGVDRDDLVSHKSDVHHGCYLVRPKPEVEARIVGGPLLYFVGRNDDIQALGFEEIESRT